MDESGNHYSQQTNTRTENQTPHVLNHRLVLSNENTWTQGGEHYTLGLLQGAGGGRPGGGWGGITLGEMPEVGDRGMETANHHGICVSM